MTSHQRDKPNGWAELTSSYPPNWQINNLWSLVFACLQPFVKKMSVTEMFSYIQGFLSADQDVREVWMNILPHSQPARRANVSHRVWSRFQTAIKLVWTGCSFVHVWRYMLEYMSSLIHVNKMIYPALIHYFLQDIRKVVQVLEQTTREILTVLQSVHQPSGFKESEQYFFDVTCTLYSTKEVSLLQVCPLHSLKLSLFFWC